MQFRLKTSKRTEEIFEKINKSLHLPPFVLAKISISLAIKDEYRVDENLQLHDTNGLDLNRQTITAEYDSLFKALIEMQEERYIEEEAYFPDYLKSYLDYGAILLEQEFRYTNTSNFYSHLLSLENSL